jgi:hypothetical protein
MEPTVLPEQLELVVLEPKELELAWERVTALLLKVVRPMGSLPENHLVVMLADFLLPSQADLLQA